MAIKNLIFDIGNVLIDFDAPRMLRDYGLSEEEIQDFMHRIFRDKLWEEFDLGNFTFQEVVDQYVRKYPEYADAIRWLMDHAERMPVYRPRVWEKVHELKELGYHLYLLSNYSDVLLEKHLIHATFREDFEGEVISYQVHTIKPHPAIYQALLEKYDLKPEESVFFDDRENNVLTGERLGLKCHQITGEQQLLDLLEQYKRDRYLAKAISYEETHEKEIRPEDRPAFHLTPRVGWLNDPNGFSLYQGKYHMFYQYYPYDVHWGPMHWGHAVSKDLLHWEYLPAALAPDQVYDRDGCFSGSAIELADGRQLLMYTAVDRTPTPEGELVDRQTQALAVGDGVRYEKLPANPILDEKDLPEDCTIVDFRDPKMVLLPDGTYRAYCVSVIPGRGGVLLQYESDDAFQWKYKSTMAVNDNRIGTKWECPDFFELDGETVFLTSPMDIQAKGDEFDNGNGTCWMTGDYDDATGSFTPKQWHSVDYGTDFYAEQTILTPDGRRVMIAWMQNWDTIHQRTAERKWYGQMTLPRELFFRDGLLCQRPIRELEACRREGVAYENLTIRDDAICLEGMEGRLLDLEVMVEAQDAADLYRKFTIQFASDGEFHTDLSYSPIDGTVELDRRYSGIRRAMLANRRTKVQGENGAILFRLILDRFSVEVFINDGEKTMSMTLETDPGADGICFLCQGAAVFSATCYTLELS